MLLPVGFSPPHPPSCLSVLFPTKPVSHVYICIGVEKGEPSLLTMKMPEVPVINRRTCLADLWGSVVGAIFHNVSHLCGIPWSPFRLILPGIESNNGCLVSVWA